jgi:hypothetical protein
MDMVLGKGHDRSVTIRILPRRLGSLISLIDGQIRFLHVCPRNWFPGSLQRTHIEAVEFGIGVGVKDVGVVVEDGVKGGWGGRVEWLGGERGFLGWPGRGSDVIDVYGRRGGFVGVEDVDGIGELEGNERRNVKKILFTHLRKVTFCIGEIKRPVLRINKKSGQIKKRKLTVYRSWWYPWGYLSKRMSANVVLREKSIYQIPKYPECQRCNPSL